MVGVVEADEGDVAGILVRLIQREGADHFRLEAVATGDLAGDLRLFDALRSREPAETGGEVIEHQSDEKEQEQSPADNDGGAEFAAGGREEATQ